MKKQILEKIESLIAKQEMLVGEINESDMYSILKKSYIRLKESRSREHDGLITEVLGYIERFDEYLYEAHVKYCRTLNALELAMEGQKALLDLI